MSSGEVGRAELSGFGTLGTVTAITFFVTVFLSPRPFLGFCREKPPLLRQEWPYRLRRSQAFPWPTWQEGGTRVAALTPDDHMCS
jgi:hypothetical protein